MQRRFFISLSVVCGFIFLSSVLGMLGNGRSPVLAAPAATTWYVDVAGDDNDNCLTPSTACATVAGAAGKAADGDAAPSDPPSLFLPLVTGN